MDRISRLHRKIDKLDNVVHVLEATANTYYSPNDEGWKVLLTARDKVKKFVDKENRKSLEEIRKITYENIEEMEKKYQ